MMASISSTVLVHRSTTRRKACAGCVMAKRRCDLTLPRCTRCRVRNLRCVYLDDNDSDKRSLEQGRTVASESGFSFEPSTAEVESPGTWSDDFLSMCQADSVCMVDPQFEVANSIESMDSFDIPFHSFAFPEHITMSTRRSDYVVTQFKTFISSFVLQNETLFIHPLLYQDAMPHIYQDALGVCSLYMQKTSCNQETIFRMLDAKLAALIQASTSLLFRVESNLLAVQTLLLYQVIRLFDGDVRQRANAERHLPLLDSWTLRLQQNYSQIIAPSVGSLRYDYWVLAESIRRTTMVSVVLRCLYSFMKDGYSELVPLLCTLPVSSKGKMWKTAEMDRRDEKETATVLTYMEFTQEWNKGNVSELDEYEKLLLVGCQFALGTEDLQLA